VPDLVRKLKVDGAAPVRAESARALGLIGPAAAAGATDALKVALQDTDAMVVEQVRAALKLVSEK
jgi:HEAT repeat protein